MATTQEVWGFGTIEVAKPSTDTTDRVAEFCRNLNAAAASRSIEPNVPSDALDMSRDIMLDEAAHAMGYTWRLWRSTTGGLDTLRLSPIGVTIHWNELSA